VSFWKALFGGKKEDGHRYKFYAPKKPVGDDDVDELARVAAKKRRPGLALPDATLSGAGLAKALAALPELKALRLAGAASLDDAALGALRSCPELEFLDLRGVPVNGSGFVELEPLAELWYLGLRETRLLDMSVLALCRFPKLHTLDVSGSRVTKRGLPYCSRLEALRILRATDLGLDESIRGELGALEELKLEADPA